MRSVVGMAAALVVCGVTTLGVTQAFAGADEASRDSFWAHQSVQGPAHQGRYLQVEPRDAKVSDSAGVNQADAGNPYINHAMGTMSGPEAVAEAAPSATSNGQYTATYQQYMQVEPRDQKVTGGSASNEDIYYYHSMGTMSH